jgi:tRNA pseudouridine13 synthase
MSDPTDDSARPAKRAKLDNDTAPSFSAGTSTAVPQAAATAHKAAIDTDLEREVRAGITEYVCPDNLGFTGVLKQRYTDFLVNEIALDGQVLHLKSTQPPKKEGRQANGGQTNGAESRRQDTKEAKLVVKEENGDAEMPDMQSRGDAASEAPVKTETVPAQEESVIKEESDQKPEVKEEEEEAIPEPEIEVSIQS